MKANEQETRKKQQKHRKFNDKSRRTKTKTKRKGKTNKRNRKGKGKGAHGQKGKGKAEKPLNFTSGPCEYQNPSRTASHALTHARTNETKRNDFPVGGSVGSTHPTNLRWNILKKDPKRNINSMYINVYITS